MKAVYLSWIWVLFAYNVAAQNEFTKKFTPLQMKEEAALLKNIVEANHPSVYWHITKDHFDSVYQQVVNGITVDMNEIEYRNKLALWLNEIFFSKSIFYQIKNNHTCLKLISPLNQQQQIKIKNSLKDRKVFTVFPEGDHGKHAVTHYKVLKRYGYVTLVECKLETGRTHQIRVHMKHIGHPLFNDARYGGDLILKGTTFTKYKQFIDNCFKILPRQALHAKTLGFVHPTTGEMMRFDTELPQDMQDCIEKWRNYSKSHEVMEEE
jgi:23S rRNA-/tRNA-specific pseudouridylate synthase